MASEVLTYDWSKCLSHETPWKFGIYDISMKLPLDYSLHLREKSFKSGVFKFSEKSLVEITLNPPSYREEPRFALELLQGVLYRLKMTHAKIYDEEVICYRRKLPDLIKFELGPFTYVYFNGHSGWPKIIKTEDLDDTNYLSYAQKGKDVFVWSGDSAIRADY